MQAMDAFSQPRTHASSRNPHPPEHSEAVRVHLRMQLSREGRADAEVGGGASPNGSRFAAEALPEGSSPNGSRGRALTVAVGVGLADALALAAALALAGALAGAEDAGVTVTGVAVALASTCAGAARSAFSFVSQSPLSVWQAESAETRMFPSGRFSSAAEQSEPETRHRSLSSQVTRSNARLSEKGASVADIPSRPMWSSAALSPDPVEGRS